MRLNNSVYAMLLLGVATATFSCGDDDSSTPGGGGKNSPSAGSGGSSTVAGKNGGGAKTDAGSPPDSVGGAGEGGGGASGGSGGEPVMSMGGEAGEGGQAPVGNCGNGKTDPGERCDDGNTVADDGCSASCTVEACDECTIEAFPPARLDVFTPPGDCSAITSGAADVKRCQDVLDCVALTNCALPNKNLPDLYYSSLPCLCGALTYDACAALETTADLTGACKNQIRAAANGMADGTKSPAYILAQFHNPKDAPLGQALRKVDDPGLLPSIGCETLVKPADQIQCRAVTDCLYQTKCAVNSTRDGAECFCGDTDNDTCFSTITDPKDPRLTGACKAAIQTAAGGAQVIPLEVSFMFFTTTTPVGAAMQLANGLRENCKDECFGSNP